LEIRRIAAALLLAGFAVAAQGNADSYLRSLALEKAQYYALQARWHQSAFRDLSAIIRGAKGNFVPLLACVEAVYACQSNTRVILALAARVAVHGDEVAHFQDLLFIAAAHQGNSDRVLREIGSFLDGNQSYSELYEKVREFL
jgi:hypothetical protein